MTALDIGIIVFAALMALAGFQTGLMVAGLSLAGFIGGAALGGRLAPKLLEGGAESSYAPLVSLLGGLVLGAMAATLLLGVAEALRGRLAGSGIGGAVDGVGGSLVFVALALAISWALAAVALHTASGNAGVREAVQRSTVLTALNRTFPPSGPILNALRRIDPTPRVEGPDARVARPNRGLLSDPDVDAASESVVRILGTACGLGISGSGWVADPGLVVTNAHVVAGQNDTVVAPGEGGELDATAVHYDTRNDLALLRVEGLPAPTLSLAPDPDRGTPGVVLGYPENGPYSESPARLGGKGEVVSQDSYGRGPVRRTMTPFRGSVRSGNSGGPMVDAAGRVLTTVFAATARSGGPSGGLGVPNRIVADAIDGPLRPVDTGPCAV